MLPAPQTVKPYIGEQTNDLREGRVSARTAKSNQLRGLLLEYGLPLPKGSAALKEAVPATLEDAENGLSGPAREVLHSLFWEWLALDAQVAEADGWVQQVSSHLEASRRLQGIPGIGPVIALALLALVGDGHTFPNCRSLAAWSGLTPQQRSTGGKTRLGGMTKHGHRSRGSFVGKQCSGVQRVSYLVS